MTDPRNNPVPALGRGIIRGARLAGRVLARTADAGAAMLRRTTAPAPAPPPSAPYAADRCRRCGGAMEAAVIRQHSWPRFLAGCALALVGVVLAITTAVTIIGPVIGGLLFLAGAGMGSRRSRVWRCTACRAVVDHG